MLGRAMTERFVARRVFALMAAAGSAGSLLATETVARADERVECATAADQAQQFRDEGKYRRAREQLLVCARETCPGPIKRDCAEWLAQLESIAPTVVFTAKEAAKDLSNVKVSVDGVVVTERLDGKPVQMDLGKHIVRFEYGGTTKEEEVVMGAGQKNRIISTTFGQAAAAKPVPVPTATEGRSEPGSLVPALILGGVGVAALGSFAFFGLSGKGDVDDMETDCKPNCEPSRVDSAKTKLLVADISLGVGIVALGVATVLVLIRPKGDGAEGKNVAQVTSKPKTAGGLSFDFGPVMGGAVGSLGARF